MPYSRNSDLPAAVRDHLPGHAQDIFREAFNSAFDQYDEADRHSLEQRAFRVAWAAVKQKYRKDGKRWVAKH